MHNNAQRNIVQSRVDWTEVVGTVYDDVPVLGQESVVLADVLARISYDTSTSRLRIVRTPPYFNASGIDATQTIVLGIFT